MQHRSRIAGWVRATVVTLLALFAIVALLLAYVVNNPAALVPVASHLTERVLGRTLSIDGEVQLNLSLAPRISVRNVRLGNAAWSDDPVMASAGYLLVQLDLPALFENRVHLLDLDIQHAEVLLEDPVGGSPNWRFFEGDDDSGAGWSFMLEGLKVDRSVVRARIGELEPMVLEIPTLEESTDTSGNLVVQGNGRLNGDPWQIQGRIGPFDELLAAGRIDLDVALVVEDVTLKTQGTIGNLETLSGLDLTLVVNGQDADVLGDIFRMPETFTGDVALTADVRSTADGQTIEVNGHVSEFVVELTGTTRNIASLDGWDATVHVQGPDAGLFGKAFQLGGFPGGPFEISGGVHRHGGDLDLKDVRITLADASLVASADFVDFPRRSRALASLRLRGSDLSHFREMLRLPALPEGTPFELDLKLDATANEVLTASFRAGDHRLTASGPVGEYPDFSGTRLSVALSGNELAELTRLAGLPDTLTGRYDAASVISIHDGGITAAGSTFSLEPFRFEGTLTLPQITDLETLTVEGSLIVGSLASAGALLAVEGLPDLPLAVSGRLSSDRSLWKLEQGSGQLKDIAATASGSLGDLTSPAGIDLDVRLEGPNVDTLVGRTLPGTENIPFTLSARVRGADAAIGIEDLVLKAQGGELRLDSHIAFAEHYVGSRITLEGRGQDLARVLPALPGYAAPHEDWEVRATLSIPSPGHVEAKPASLRMGTASLNIFGILDIENQDQTNLSLTTTGESLRDIGRFGEIDLPELPFSVSLELAGSTSVIRIPRFEASWGESDLLAQGSVDLSDTPDVVLKGTSRTLRIDDLQQAIFGDLEEETTGTSARLFPDAPIPMEALNLNHWQVSIDVGEFQGRRIRMHDVDLAFTIRDGALTIERVLYRDETGTFRAVGTLLPTGSRPNEAHLTLHVQGENADLGMFTSPDQPPDSIPRYDLDIAIDGVGTTVAELVGSVNGSLLISSDGGRISNALLKTYAGDFLTNVLDVINPFVKNEPFTPVDCLVLNAAIEDGKLDLVPGFVMRTNQLNMFVLGSVDLKTEKLNLSLATQARRGIGISAATVTNPYFKIGGTLTAPALQLDAQSAAVAASVAAATAGLSIVIRGVWSRLMGEQDPCPQFLNYERKEADKGS